MNVVEKFESTLQKLSNCSLLGFRGYKIDKLLAIQTQECVLNKTNEIGFGSFIKLIFVETFFMGYHYDFDSIKNCKSVLFYSHLHAARKDYVEFMNLVASTSEQSKTFTGESRSKADRPISRHFSNLFIIVYICVWYFCLKKNGIDQRFIRRFICQLVQMRQWLFVLQENKEILKTIGSFVSIFDAREFENIATQYVRRLGVVTATLQHGHFGEMHYESPTNYYIDIASAGFVSDYFFAWGEYSKNRAIRASIPSEKIIVVGCPEYIRNISIKSTRGVVGVVCDGGREAHNDNFNMISIAKYYAKKNNYKVLIKLHPSDNVSNYNSLINENLTLFNGSVLDFAKEVEFSICCNSSVLILLLSYKSLVYRYKPSNMYDMYSLLDKWSFISYDGFMNIMKNHTDYLKALGQLSLSENVMETYNKTLKQLFNK